ALLVKLGPGDHILVLNMHHIVADGWSIGILVEELTKLYGAKRRGEEAKLAELEVQYGDFAVWQREWLQGEVLDRQMRYWKQQLGGAARVLEMSTARVRPAVQSYAGAYERFELSQEVSEAIRGQSRRAGATTYMVLLAGFEVLLNRYSGQRDLSVGTAIANRNRAEIEKLIGFFVNTLVMRVEVEGKERFTELVRRVKEVALGAYAHQDLPFEKLVEELQPERSMSHSPLFQVMFALQNTERRKLELEGLTLSPFEIG